MIDEAAFRAEWIWEAIPATSPQGPTPQREHVICDGLMWRGAMLGWIEAFDETGPYYAHALTKRLGGISVLSEMKSGAVPGRAKGAASLARARELVERHVINVICGETVAARNAATKQGTSHG